MTSRDFCFWLQGYFEIHGNQPFPPEPETLSLLNSEQIKTIEKHLAMVFVHEIDSSFGKDNQKLDEIHGMVSPQQAEFYAQNPQFDPRIRYAEGDARPKC